MKFVREQHSAVTVRHVEQGAVKIGDETITENILLFRDSIARGWSTNDAGEPEENYLSELIAEKPEIIIFGTGWGTRLPPRALVFELARQGIGFETMDTPAACRTFNILISEDRDVAALLQIR